MTARRIRVLGDPALRTHSEVVEDPTSAGARVIAGDLKDSLQEIRLKFNAPRAAIAGPQIGAPLRFIYLEMEGREPQWMCNPLIVDVGPEDFYAWEGCFSFPELLVRVQRAYSIKVKSQDLNGNENVIEAEGKLAQLLQHEIDHLDGVLSVDRAVGLDPFCLREEWARSRPAEDRLGSPFPRTVSA